VWFGDSLRIWNKCFPFIKSFFNQCQSKRGVTCLNDVDNAGRLGDDDKFDHVLAFLFFLFFAVVGYAVFHFLWLFLMCSVFWETLFRKAFLGKDADSIWGASPEIYQFSLLLLA